MVKGNLTDELLEKVIEIAREAGAATMEIYASGDFDVEEKSDDASFISPLTKADKAADDLIQRKLKEISDYPIISEESEGRVSGEYFWLVDPLDGTKDFIKRKDNFTVNIALIHNGEPVMGVVYAPALDLLYTGLRGEGAYKVAEGKKTAISAQYERDKKIVATSRSHKDERTEKLLESLGDYEDINIGSSLKLCYVADGTVMLYPRLAPTYLWDTAAADAVVRAAGGRVTDLKGELLRYEPAKDMKNPYFVVSPRNSIDWQKYLSKE